MGEYFGYMKDLTTGRPAVGKKDTCKLCLLKVAHSGGTTNLKNHLRSYHRPEFRNLYSDNLAEVQSQPKMDVFCKPSRTVQKLSPVSARAQELTSAIVDLVVHDLRPVNVVDCVGFLHLMEVAEPQYMVPCRRTVNGYINKQYLGVKARVQQELKQVDYMGMTTDMWTLRSKYGYISITAHYISPQFVMKHHNLQSCHPVDLHMQVPAFTTDNAKNVVNAISENLMLVAIPCVRCTGCERSENCFGKSQEGC